MTQFSRPSGFDRPSQSRFRSAVRVACRFARGVAPIWSRITKRRSVLSWVLETGTDVRTRSELNDQMGEDARSADFALLFGSEKEGEVNLKDRFEETHVGALVKTDLVFPNVDDQDFRDGNGEEGGFALKVLYTTY